MRIIVYSKNNCIYCTKAKGLLDKLNLKYIEKKFEDYKSVDDFKKDIGKQVRTMPQIKINGNLIGGYNQLVEHFTTEGLVNFKGEIVERRQG